MMQRQPPPQGMGCFAKGCLTLIIAIVAFVIVCGVGGWFLLTRTIDNLTALQPASIQIATPTNVQSQGAASKAQQLRTALQSNQETTVVFTADDINALIAQDPNFRGVRGSAHVAINNSIVSLELSAPLRSFPWSHVKERWFNGEIQFGFSYVDDKVVVDPKAAEANGHHVPSWILSSDFKTRLNDGINQGFHDSLRKDPKSQEFWSHIKLAYVQDDKLIVTTRPK